MSKTFIPGGRGGGGGGLHYRDPPDQFLAASLVAARTARDTAFAAGGTLAGVLDEYADDRSLAIILGVTGATARTFETYTGEAGEAYDNTKWVERTDATQGIQGKQGRFQIFCYDTAATAPTTPTGGSYVLSTGALTVPTGTTAAPVEPPANQFSWRSQATINPATQSGTVTPTWSAFTTDVEEALAARAEAAETNAETAQTAAEVAQAAAEAAQTAAGTAQTNAETAETASEMAQSRAEAAQSGAETALAGSGTALAFNELWSGDLLLSAANQWHALGTEAVPANATWLLWNGGTLTDGTNDGPAALWTWINAADWRALTADTVGTTPGDGTGMLFADWCASDIGDGTPDFTRRDAVIGRTSEDIPLLMGPQTGESYFGARLMYITQAMATPGGGGGASSFADLTGMIADSQVPAAFTRDTELALYALLAGAVFTGAVSGITPTAAAHLSRKDYVDAADALKASLAGATFTGAAAGITPTADAHFATKAYVDNRTNMPTHTTDQYVAIKATSSFDAADFTGANGDPFPAGSSVGTVPNTLTGNVFAAFARLASDPTPNFLDLDNSGINQFGALMQQAGTETVNSAAYNVWVLENAGAYQGVSAEFR